MRARRLFLPFVLVVLTAAAPALAVETPRGGRADARIKTVVFDPDQVVRLIGVPRTATQVVFAADETITHLALGDSAAWQTAADRNVLFLKPRPGARPTNLIVTTARPGGARSYVFELRAAAAHAAYVLRFRYPGDDTARARAAVSAAAQALQHRLTGLELDRGLTDGPRNLAWSVQGPADLEPSEVSDNGRVTRLRFPGARALPAVYAVAPDGTERLAAVEVRGDVVLIPGTAPGYRLRRGAEVLCLTNRAWRPAGAPTGTRTAARDVVRTEIGSRR